MLTSIIEIRKKIEPIFNINLVNNLRDERIYYETGESPIERYNIYGEPIRCMNCGSLFHVQKYCK